jgi:hypothetical protein
VLPGHVRSKTKGKVLRLAAFTNRAELPEAATVLQQQLETAGFTVKQVSSSTSRPPGRLQVEGLLFQAGDRPLEFLDIEGGPRPDSRRTCSPAPRTDASPMAGHR